jgi:hypothetical protein
MGLLSRRMANGDRDRQTFKTLWTTWKAGKGKPEVEPEKMRLLATARKLLGEDVDGFCEPSLRYLQQTREDTVRRVQEAGLRGGAALTVLIDDAPVGIAIVAPADRSLNVYVAESVHRGGLGELVARKAISFGFERGLADVTARARPGTSGAGLAEKLGFRPTGGDSREVLLALRPDEWKP